MNIDESRLPFPGQPDPTGLTESVCWGVKHSHCSLNDAECLRLQRREIRRANFGMAVLLTLLVGAMILFHVAILFS